MTASATCLVSFDRNKYSVMARAARRAVQIRAHAGRIVVRFYGEVVAEHPHCFGRDRTVYKRWHYCRCWPASPARFATGRRSWTGRSLQRWRGYSASSGRRRGRPAVRAGAGHGPDR